MNRILVVAQHDGNKLNPATARSVNCATDIGDIIDVVVFHDGATSVCEQAARLDRVKNVLEINRTENLRPLAAVLAPQIVALATDYTHVLVGSTT